MCSSIGRPGIAIRCPWKSKPAARIWCANSRSFVQRSSSRSARSPHRRCSKRSSRSANSAARCIATTAFRSWSRITRQRSFGIRRGSAQPGKMSSSPVEYSIAPQGRDPYSERRPPYSEDAEQAVLAAMLMDGDAIMRAAEYVNDSMFYAERHRRIFRALISITERGAVADPLTLADELERRGELPASGGKEYIAFLVDAVPTSANVEFHARIVREKALLRNLIEVSTKIVTEAFEGRTQA